jgi:putative protease
MGILNASRIRRGDLVWRTHDPDLDREARPYLDAPVPLRKQAVGVKVTAREGERLQTEWSLGEWKVAVESDAVLGRARERVLEEEYLRRSWAASEIRPYELAGWSCRLMGEPFARELDAESGAPRGGGASGRTASGAAGAKGRASTAGAVGAEPWRQRPPKFICWVRTPEQLDAAIELRPASVTLDYLDLYGLRPSLDRIREAGLKPRVASPRVLKPAKSGSRISW